MELVDILRLPAAARRAELRKLTAPLFDAHRTMVLNAINHSPIVGPEANQMKLRNLPSALRDALDWQTLLLIADRPGEIAAVCQAVQNPAGHGMKDATTKTGYRFGRPAHADDLYITTIIDKINAKGAAPMTTTTATVATPATDLSSLIDLYDVVDRNSMAEFDNIILAMKEVSAPIEHSRIDAMAKALAARGKRNPANPLKAIDETVYRAVMDKLSGKTSAPAIAATSHPLSKVATEHEGIINAVLNVAKLPPINQLIDDLNQATAQLIKARGEVEALKAKPTASITLMTPGTTVAVPASGGKPHGTVSARPAWEVFGFEKGGLFDFEVPVWTWEFKHPDQKAVDENYIFRQEELLSLLYAVMTNERCWLHGHTGTGKTTLIEQVAARLNWPVRVVNFDSEITRMDLIGRDTLTNEDGVTVSKFIDGILPQCMVEPYWLICDEFDFIRPDVSYVMQRAFEGNGMTITEDGGRHVTPHAMFRIFATANTQGQGDDYGMYAGARVQSMALLDRFTAWIQVDYLPADMRRDLLGKAVPHLDVKLADQVAKYVTEHIEAFKTAKVVKPISPRGMIALGKAIANLQALMPKSEAKKAVDLAISRTILNACTQQDKVVLNGIVKRVFV